MRGLVVTACLAFAVGCGKTAVSAVAETRVPVTLAQSDAIDLLFVLDNSLSTSQLKRELQTAFPAFMRTLSSTRPASYHIGVVDSDLGAGTLNQSGCRPLGDGGKLIALGSAADPSCTAPTEAPFVRFDELSSTSNLPPMQDLATTFTCMSDVGGGGCGFEHPLESMRRALLGPVPQNDGFVRDDALLVVVILMDEDDCSAPLDSDLFDSSKFMEYGELQSFRCVRFGYLCDGAMPPAGDSMGPMSCRPATMAEGGKLFDIERYTDLFTKSRAEGGIKDDPNRIVVASLAGPASSVTTLLAKPNTEPGGYVSCSGPTGPSCQPVVQHGCVSPVNGAFVGDPAVRIETAVRAAAQHHIASVCDLPYDPTMQAIAARVLASRDGGCIAAEIDTSAPRCSVVDTMVPHALSLPECARAPQDAPCWTVEPFEGCTFGQRLRVQNVDGPLDRYAANCVKR